MKMHLLLLLLNALLYFKFSFCHYPFGPFPPVKSSEDEDCGASVADDDDDDDDEDAGSDIGSVDSRAHSRRIIRGACKGKPIRTQHKARKWQRGRRRCSSEEEEEDSEEEMGKCLWVELR